MELARQKAFKMRDKLVQDFREIKNNFSNNFPDSFPKPKHVKQPNGCYKIVHKSTSSRWRASQQGEKWIKDLDVFLDHLSNNVTGPDKTVEEIAEELSIVLKGVSKNGMAAEIDWMTCSKEVFAIYIVRDCLKNEMLPIFITPNWQAFARDYSKFLMAI